MGGCMGKPDPAFARKGHDTTILKEKAAPVIWIVGCHGSGRATQTSKALASFGFVHINSSDLIQAEIASESDRGLKLKEYMDAGKKLPKGVIVDIVIEKMLAVVDSAKGFICDGFPRDKAQAKLFEKDVYPVSGVIYLECSPDVMKVRLLERGRPEDTEEIINKQIKTFKKTSLGVAKGYKKKCKTVNGEAEPDEVFENVKAGIEGAIS